MIKLKTIEPKKDNVNNIARKKDLNHIWDEINKSTTGIFLHYCNSKKNDFVYRLFSQPEPYRYDRGLTSEKDFKKKFPNFVMINLFEYTPNSIDSLKGIPQNLPKLSILSIKSHEFRSLKGLPSKLPNLKKLSIESTPLEYLIKNSNERKIASKIGSPLSNLNGLPNSLPNLENLFISNTHIANISDLPKNLPSLRTFVIHDLFRTSNKGSLSSLKGLPKELPSLEIFGIYNCPIQTLGHIPSSLSKLKKFSINGCPLRNLRGFPKYVPNLEELNITGNNLVSLEGLPSEFPKIKKLHLGSNNLTSLRHIPQNINRSARIGIENNPLRSLCYLNHEFTFKVMVQSIRSKGLFETYCKGFDLGPRFDEFVSGYLTPYERIDEDIGELETGHFCNVEIIDQIQDYYRKTTTELIRQYISKPNSISKDELERIIWEANTEDRDALESNFPNDNAVIQKINQRLKFTLLSGHSIFK